MATGRNARGFTVIELMIVVTILGILAGIALPSFNEMIANNRRTTTVNELLSNFMLSRAEAAKRGQPVIVCGVDDANNNKVLEVGEQACVATDWRDGWMVVIDADADGVVDAAELPPLKVYVNSYSIRVTALKLDGTALTDVGVILKPFNQQSTEARVTVCDKRGAPKSRAVDLNVSGRGRIVTNNSEDAAGVALACP